MFIASVTASRRLQIAPGDAIVSRGSRRAAQASAREGRSRLKVVADKGYSSAREVEACLEANITPYLPKPETSANKALGLFTKNDFRYDAERDLYICPAGQELTFRHAAHEQGRDIRYYRPYACRHCPLQPRLHTEHTIAAHLTVGERTRSGTDE